MQGLIRLSGRDQWFSWLRSSSRSCDPKESFISIGFVSCNTVYILYSTVCNVFAYVLTRTLPLFIGFHSLFANKSLERHVRCTTTYVHCASTWLTRSHVGSFRVDLSELVLRSIIRAGIDNYYSMYSTNLTEQECVTSTKFC